MQFCVRGHREGLKSRILGLLLFDSTITVDSLNLVTVKDVISPIVFGDLLFYLQLLRVSSCQKNNTLGPLAA
jgi:hypothetical protein